MAPDPKIFPVVDFHAPAHVILDRCAEAGALFAYWRGTKWRLGGLEACPAPQGLADSLRPGQVVAPANGPIVVATGDGFLRVNEYAIEGSRHYWRCENRFEEALSLILGPEDQPRGEVVFGPRRFPDWDSIVFRFQAAVGVEHRHKGSEGRPFGLDRSYLYLANRDFFFHLFEKLGLKPGQRFLDIGCSMLPFSCRAAHEYGLEAFGCDLIDETNYPDYDWMTYFQADVSAFPDLPLQFDLIFNRDLTPLAYCRSFDCPELTRFKRKILEGLTPSGAFYWVHMSNNTGRPRSEDDFGHLTMRDMVDWIGRGFRYCDTARSTYLSLLASNGPVRDVRQIVPESGLGPDVHQRCWADMQNEGLGEKEYFHVLMRISNRMWRPLDFRADRPVGIVGSGPLAEDLAHVLKTIHRNVQFAGIVAPAEASADAFWFVMPDCDPAEVAGTTYPVTWRELNLLAGAKDYYCVDGSHDAAALSNNVLAALDNRRAQAAVKNERKHLLEASALAASRDYPALLEFCRTQMGLGNAEKQSSLAAELLLYVHGLGEVEDFLAGLDMSDDQKRRALNDMKRAARAAGLETPAAETTAANGEAENSEAPQAEMPSAGEASNPDG